MYQNELTEDRPMDAAHVLIVDDDRAIRETLRFLLEDADYIVQDAPDGLVALDALRASPYPLVVLLDLQMPRLDGLGVLRAVADDPHLATFHAYVIVTANLHLFAPALTSLLARLRVEVIRKPFDIDVLLDRVEEATQRLMPAGWRQSAPGHSLPGHPMVH